MGNVEKYPKVKKISGLTSFLKPLYDLQRLFKKSKCKGIIIGGIANNLIARPRFTADIDAVILLENENIPKFLGLANKIGFIARINAPVDFAKKNRVLLLHHKNSAIDIDISLGLLPFEKKAIKNSRLVKIGRLEFRIPTPEDLIIFKAVAHREKDMMDIRGVVETNPNLNIKRIKKVVVEFAKALDNPDIWNNVEKIIKQFLRKY